MQDSSAALAYALLADLASDDGHDDEARTLYLDAARSFPAGSVAARSHFQAAIIAFVQRSNRQAAVEMDSLRARYPTSDEATASMYWSGRSWNATGETERAQARWREVIAKQPYSYYAMLSARRLGVSIPAPPSSTESYPHVGAVDSAFARAALLDALGMDVEARFEYERLSADGLASPLLDRIIATAFGFLRAELPSRAAELGWRALARGVPADARTYRLIYAVLDREELAAEAKARSVDPALIAGLIRQESNWNSRAISVAGARGLMQIMPAVGRDVGRSLGITEWTTAMLNEPEINIAIGVRHFATFARQYDDLTRLLAAYNAGGSRVKRWSSRAGVADAEVFAERIPFVETREYVRVVQRNAELYRALYNW
ncbi:MAG: transglycosylase SLT domain-containing protein [Gemmatimonadota bacterium]|nr:transglycosylase SLT domain-containing protein [Gemmatimonadota bacterium]